MAYPLEDFRLRMERADEKIDELAAKVTAFLDTKPYEVIGQFYPKTGQYVLRGYVHGSTPKTFSLHAAEVAHQLRSCLENLATVLARTYSKHAPDGTGFPIFLNPAAFSALSETTGAPSGKSGLYKIRGLHPDPQAAIERLQPYNRGKELDPLWQLHVIDIIDKHGRDIEPAATIPEKVGVGIRNMWGVELHVERLGVRPGPFKNGTVVGTMTFIVPNPDAAYVEMNTDIAFDVAFNPKGPARGGRIIPTLRELSQHVREVVLPEVQEWL